MNEWWKNTFGGERIGDINLFPGFWDKVNESTNKAMDHPVMHKDLEDIKKDIKEKTELVPQWLGVGLIAVLILLMFKR